MPKINPDDPQSLHDSLIEAHRSFYAAAPQNQLDAMIFLYGEDGSGYGVVLPMGDDDERSEIADALRQHIKALNIKTYAFVAEAWLAEVNGPISRAPKPSTQENRREVVVTLVRCRDGRKVGSVVELKRDWETGDASLGEVEPMEGDRFGGRFAELFDA